MPSFLFFHLAVEARRLTVPMSSGLTEARRLNMTEEEEPEEPRPFGSYPVDLLLGDPADYEDGSYFNVKPAGTKMCHEHSAKHLPTDKA